MLSAIFQKKKTKQDKNLPLVNWIPKAMVQFTHSRLLYCKQERIRKCLLGLINIQRFIKFTFVLMYGVK